MSVDQGYILFAIGDIQLRVELEAALRYDPRGSSSRVITTASEAPGDNRAAPDQRLHTMLLKHQRQSWRGSTSPK